MKYLSLIFLFSTSVFAAQNCELSLYQGDDILKSKTYVLTQPVGKNQAFVKLSNRYYEDHKKKHHSVQYSVSSFIEYNGTQVKSTDFIIQRKVEKYSIGKLPASLFSQIQSSYPLERISIRLQKGVGKKVYEIDKENSLELSCKNS